MNQTRVQKLREAGHSCLTCHLTKKAYGAKLFCQALGKLTDQHNICHHHTVKEIKHGSNNK